MKVRKGVVASACSTSMLKSMRIDPKPQPPAAANAWMIPSEVALFGSVETSVFHGLAASKSRPARVVVVGATVVVVLVVGREVDVLVLVLVDVVDDDVVGIGAIVLVEVLAVLGEVVDEVVADVELVVGFVVKVEVLEVELLELDDVEVAVVDVVGRVVDVEDVGGCVVDDDVVVVCFFLLALAAAPHAQPPHGSPLEQSAVVSHCSPASTSSRPSPQVDDVAVNDRRLVARADSVTRTFTMRVPYWSRTTRGAPLVAVESQVLGALATAYST